MGQEHSGHVGCMGLGPTPTQVFKSKSRQFHGIVIRNESYMENMDESSRLSIVESYIVDIFSMLGRNGSTQANGMSTIQTNEISVQKYFFYALKCRHF